MEIKDAFISPVGVEHPRIHSILVNGMLFNVAIELQSVVLVGASINSLNSEYRQFNLDTQIVRNLLKERGDPSMIKFFNRIKNAIDNKIKKDILTVDNNEIKNVSYDGISYAIIYYLLLKRFEYTEEKLVNLNAFSVVVSINEILNNIISQMPRIRPNASELKTFTDYVMNYSKNRYYIGSKLLYLTRYQVSNTNDLSQSIWKSMYINRILRNIPAQNRMWFFTPLLDWGLIKCVAKHTFTNDSLINKVAFGENISYIQSSANKQNQLASELITGHLYDTALEDIKKLTLKLKEATIDIDYALGDLILVMFYSNMGNTLINEMNAFIELSKSNSRISTDSLISTSMVNHESFRQLIFQYLYALFLLTKQGIIHNDVHLNNILLTKNTTKSSQRCEFQLSPGKTISIPFPEVNLTIIDYDKSILSHHHHNHFNKNVLQINEEMGIVFDDIKKTISNDYDQVFNCYAMYDVVKFGLIMQHLLDDMKQIIGPLLPKNVISSNQAFLDKMIKMATDTLYKIYEHNPKFPFDLNESHKSMEWLIMSLFKDYARVNKTKSSIAKGTHINTKMRSSLSADTPEFISSRRKYADTLKYNYISQYISLADSKNACN